MKKKFRIKQIRPGIFLLNFKKQYDLAMHFLRYQEYYESPSRRFRHQSFTLVDFMDWYVKQSGKSTFTYPDDWEGFNLPSHVIPDYSYFVRIPDENYYDIAMYEAWVECDRKMKGNDFYLIGCVGDDENITLKHEIAHGYFYLHKNYRKQMTKLVKELPARVRTKINKHLKDIGYCKAVYVDETQAYLSEGRAKEWINLLDVGEKFYRAFEAFDWEQRGK